MRSSPSPRQSWDDLLQSVRDIDVAPLLELKTEDNSWLVDLKKKKSNCVIGVTGVGAE